MIICAGDIENFSFATPIGIGLVNSAIKLTKIVLDQNPKSLTFIGTAGSYGKHKPFDIVESGVATNIENSYLTKGSYTPIENKIVSRETIDIINSSNYITIDKTLSKHYQNRGIELENMEFFSVLKVAKEFDIKATGIFIVTNYCDKNAHQDFIKNHDKAKQLLIKYMEKNHE
jgi:nucleoside phosphorylase